MGFETIFIIILGLAIIVGAIVFNRKVNRETRNRPVETVVETVVETEDEKNTRLKEKVGKENAIIRHMFLSTILCCILSTLFVSVNMDKDIMTIIYFHWEVVLGTVFGSSIPALIYLSTRNSKRKVDIFTWYVAQNFIVFLVYSGKISPLGEFMN